MTQNPPAPSSSETPDRPLPAAGPLATGRLSGLTWWSAGLMALGFAPLLLEFFSNLSKIPQYQFFPGALAAAGFLAWSRLKEVPRPLEAGRPLVTVPVLLLSFAILLVAVLAWSPWLGAVASLVCAAGVIWWLGGWALMKHMTPAMVMLLTIIPPPLGLDTKLTLFLREIATTASSRLLDLLRVVHSVSGNVIELPQQKLLVEEACSGINSVLVISSFTLFYLLWRRRSIWCYLICLPAAMGFVVMGNVARITLGAWLRFHDGIDLLTGWKHETLGIILVAIYIGLVMSLEHFLHWPREARSSRRGMRAGRDAVISPAPAVRRRMSPVWGWVAGILFGVMGIAGGARCYSFHRETLRTSGQTALRSGATFDLPQQIGSWARSSSGEPTLKKLETVGLSSMLWKFTSSSNTVAGIAFDYPIWGYHDVALCYTGNGWNIFRRERVTREATTPPWLEMEMRHDLQGHGLLLVSTINERGQWMEVADVQRSFLDRLRIGSLGGQNETSYRIQLLITGEVPLSGEEKESATKLFQESRARLAQQLLGQLNTPQTAAK